MFNYFSHLKKVGKTLTSKNFKDLLQNDNLKKNFNCTRVSFTYFCKEELKKKITRNDHRELLELTSICLGTSDKITFRGPRPTHHARWKSKALYCLKMYLFREEFKLTEYENNALADNVLLSFDCVSSFGLIAFIHLKHFIRT